MTTFDWTTAIAECCTHLASLGNLPPQEIDEPALQAIALLSLVADTCVDHALTANSTHPKLRISRYTGRHDLVTDLLTDLRWSIDSFACGERQTFSAKNWLLKHRFR
jgi:hypothetical protein